MRLLIWLLCVATQNYCYYYLLLFIINPDVKLIALFCSNNYSVLTVVLFFSYKVNYCVFYIQKNIYVLLLFYIC